MLSHRGDASICHGSSSGSARDRVIVSYTEHVDVYAARSAASGGWASGESVDGGERVSVGANGANHVRQGVGVRRGTVG
jgi:hypothetical protein